MIKEKSDALQKTLYDLSSKLYQQAGGAQAGGPDMSNMGGNAGADTSSNGGDDDVIDADYKEV